MIELLIYSPEPVLEFLGAGSYQPSLRERALAAWDDYQAESDELARGVGALVWTPAEFGAALRMLRAAEKEGHDVARLREAIEGYLRDET